MSNQTNDTLMEKAHDLMEYFASQWQERVLQRAIDDNDMEALQYHVEDFWGQMSMQEGSMIDIFGPMNKALDEAGLPYNESITLNGKEEQTDV